MNASLQESEEDDEEEEEEERRKTIMIGPSFQARVPEGLHPYGHIPPYENDDRLLWRPTLDSDTVEGYLQAYSKKSKCAGGVAALPLGAHVRDDEYALHLLLQVFPSLSPDIPPLSKYFPYLSPGILLLFLQAFPLSFSMYSPSFYGYSASLQVFRLSFSSSS